jgi:hypothetical protein
LRKQLLALVDEMDGAVALVNENKGVNAVAAAD